jgi:hypothetical protein
MATTALVNSQLPFNDPAAAPFDLSVADINQLFQSSLLIDFGTDVTPVQIWANIVRISAARNGIHPTVLRALTDELVRFVRCNSYVFRDSRLVVMN